MNQKYTFKGKSIFDYSESETKDMADNNPADFEELCKIYDLYGAERKAEGEQELEVERKKYGGMTKQEYENSMTLDEWKTYKENQKRAEQEPDNETSQRWNEASKIHNKNCLESFNTVCEAIRVHFTVKFPSKFGGTRNHRQLEKALLDERKKYIFATSHLVDYKLIDYVDSAEKILNDDQRWKKSHEIFPLTKVELSDGSIFDFGVEMGKYGTGAVFNWVNQCDSCIKGSSTVECRSCLGTGQNSHCSDGRRTINHERRRRRELKIQQTHEWLEKCENWNKEKNEIC